MGTAIAPIGLAMQGASAIMGGIAGQGQGEYNAAVAEIHAKEAQTAADQTDSQLRDELRGTLQNINAIRASAGQSTDSPTIRAVMDNETRISDQQRTIKRASYMSQIAADRAEADMQRSAAQTALFGGVLKSIPSFLDAGDGFSKMF